MHRQQGGWRLNEYFFTVGPAPELEVLEAVTDEEATGHPLQVSYRPVLLDRFPLLDSEGTRIENGISEFCFPSGLKLCRGMQMPKFFCFVLTDAEGDRMYGNCLTIYEQAPAAMQERLEAEIAEWEERKRRKEEEEAEAKRKQLEQEQLAAKTATGAGGAGNSPRAEQGAVAPPDGAPGEEGSSSHTSEGAADDQSATPEAGSSDGQAAASAASEAEEDKPPDTAGEAAPATADGSAPPAAPAVEPEQPPPEPSPPQPIFAPKCLCLLSKWPFINSSRSWLMQLYRLSLSPSPLPLERYICNFLQEVPCPVPGKVEVQYTMLDQVIEYPAPPVDEPLSWSGLNCEPLFECLSLDNVLHVFNMVLLENQVLFHSSQLSLLTLCGEVLSNLLYPLTWCHVYIPVLPRQCLYIPTNSPVPFLLGLHSDVYRSIKAQVPDTVFVVDLDHNHITLAPALPLPPLPERRRVKLHKALKDHANLFETRDSNWAERCLKNLDDPFTQAGRPKDMTPLQAADGNHGHGGSAADWDMVRDAFLGFFAAVLKDYRKFMVYPTPENPKPKSIFRQAEFIASQPPEWTAFLLELCRTQAFQSFLDGRLAPDPDDPDVAHFDEAIDIKVNRSRFSLMTRRNTPHFRRGNALSGHSELKTVVALQPDTSQLPSGSKDGSPALFTYTGFPSLTDRWYLPPRPVAEIMLADGMKRKGNKKKRHNILRFKSEEVPSDPATLVFSTFLMAFELTIGKELSDLNAQGAGSSRNLHGADKPPPPPSPPRHKPSSDSTDASAAQPTATTTTATQAHDEQQPPPDQSQPPPAPAQEEPASSSPAQAAEGAAAAAAPAPHVEVAPVGEEGLPPPTVVVVKRSPPPKPPRLGAKMRRLSEDLKEERLHAANGKLAMAFDLLTRMKAQRVAPDEMVFRSLIDACGRLGNVDLAMKALGEMNAAGFMPDASVYSCLVAAFAMNDQKQGHAAYQASQTLAMLDWNKIRNAGREANGHMRPKSLNLKLDVKLGTTSKAFKDAFQAFRKMSTPSMPAMSTFWTTTSGTNSPASHSNHSNSSNHNGSSSQQPTPSSSSAATGSDDAQLSASATPRPDTDAPVAPAPPGKQVVLMDQQATVIPSSSSSASADLGMELDEAALQDAMAADNHAHTAGTPTTAGSTSSNSSSSSSGGASTGDHKEGAGSARPVSVKRSASSMACNTAPIKYQVLYGESLLTMLFPDLVLDTDCETCPDCQAKLPASAIQSGWLPDPNNYTTQCPLCVAARASELLHSLPASTLSFGTTLSASMVSGALMTSTPHADHTPLATPRSAPLPSTASSSSVISDVGEPLAVSTSAATTRRSSLLATMSSSVGSGIPRPPPRRFVARFSVHCSDPNWVGSTGPGSLLWCEYLSPWVLRKEVQSIVLNDGIDTLTDPGFRTSSQASSTIFWNLVLWFREYCLPLTFLLQPSAQQNLTRQASSSSF